MLHRYLYTPDGKVRRNRMTAVVIGCVSIAVLGTFGLVVTPAFGGHENLQIWWVIFSVFLLKAPLATLLCWFIVRNKEWPFLPPKWSPEETREILAYLKSETERVLGLPDAPERLAYLQGEAWHVADRSKGELKADAVDLAVAIGRYRIRPSSLGIGKL